MPNAVRTAEFVSPKHPDKLCDRLADAILGAHTAQDPTARVAVEVMAGHGLCVVGGEITSTGKPDIAEIARRFLASEGWPDMKVVVNVARQSPEIARGVDAGGAGDQGIMVGYACDETSEHLPLEYVLARDLCMKIFERWPNDGKTQVTVDGTRPTVVVASFQNAPKAELEPFVRRAVKADTYLINPAGDWTLGGFDADSGLSGRKIVVDAYGPRVPVGGGSFAGKDMTKVDRSGALAARRIAVDLLKKHRAREVIVRLAYAIGIPEPVMAAADIDGVSSDVDGYDLTPAGIKRLIG